MEFLRTDFTGEENLLLGDGNEHWPPSSPEKSVPECRRYRSKRAASGRWRTDSSGVSVGRCQECFLFFDSSIGEPILKRRRRGDEQILEFSSGSNLLLVFLRNQIVVVVVVVVVVVEILRVGGVILEGKSAAIGAIEEHSQGFTAATTEMDEGTSVGASSRATSDGTLRG